MTTPIEKVDEIIRLKLSGMKSRDIAEQVFGKRSSKSTVNAVYKRWLDGDQECSFNVSEESREKLASNMAKVLTLDVETAMHLGYFFNTFGRVNIKPVQIKEYPYMLTFACKWLHEDKVHGYKLPDFPMWGVDKKSDYDLIAKLWEFVNVCDILVAHNANFDEGWFNQQCILHGFPPVEPTKIICTYKALKAITSLPSKSLDYSTQYFRTLGEKLKHEGVSLWRRCMEGDESAYEEMLTYNMGDIPTAEQLYLRIRPFMKNHPNVGLYMKSDVPVCLVCGSNELEPISTTAKTNISIFPAYRCKCCGKVQRGGASLNSKEHRSNQMRNI